jgi:hypothetical protein
MLSPLLILACSSQVGSGYIVTNDEYQLVVAAPSYTERASSSWLAVESAKASTQLVEILRKSPGTILVDTQSKVKGLEADTPVMDLSTQWDGKIAAALQGTDEAAAAQALADANIKGILLHSSIRATFDRDSRILSKLYHHDALTRFQLVLVDQDLMLYLVQPLAGLTPEVANAAIQWLRAQLSGQNPAPFPALKPETGIWMLLGSIRKHGQEVAVSLADGKTFDLALDELAHDLEMVHRRYKEILGFPRLSTDLQSYSFEIYRITEMAQVLAKEDEQLADLWELGIDGAILHQVKQDDAGKVLDVREAALPGASAALRGDGDVDDFLRAVAKEGRLDSVRPWREEQNRLFIIRTSGYREIPGKPSLSPEIPAIPSSVAPLYRGTLPVPMELVTQTSARESILLMGEWYLSNLQQDGSVIYKYWPEDNRYSSEYNHVRHELATWNLWQAWTLDPRPEFLEGAQRSQLWTLKSLVRREPHELENWEKEEFKTVSTSLKSEIEKEGMAYFTYGNNTKLGSVVVGLFGMIELARSTGDHSQDDLIRDLGRFVRFMQLPSGTFRGYHVPPGHSSFQTSNDIVPGEAALALVYLYEYFQDPVYLESLQKFFDYYKPWFEERAGRLRSDHPWPAWTYDNDTRLELVQFGPWTVMAADAYTRVRPEAKDVADFGLKVGRWMIDAYAYTPERSPFPDYLGGYYKFEGELPAMQAFCYAEGTAAAYNMALRQRPDQAPFFEQATRASLRFGMQMQHDAFDTFAFARPEQVIGGVKYAMNQPKVRIDYVYHAQSAFYQWLKASERDPALPEMARKLPDEQTKRVLALMGYPGYREGSRPIPGPVPPEVSKKDPEDDGE